MNKIKQTRSPKSIGLHRTPHSLPLSRLYPGILCFSVKMDPMGLSSPKYCSFSDRPLLSDPPSARRRAEVPYEWPYTC